jgi:hypothetical protein
MKSQILQSVFLGGGLLAGALIFPQLNESQEEIQARAATEEFRKEVENSKSLKAYSDAMGGFESFKKTSPVWKRLDEADKQAAAIKTARENKAWLLGALSAFGFISGALCISSAQNPPKQRNEGALLPDGYSNRAADSENRSSGVAIASPETEKFDRGIKGNFIDGKTPIFLWLEDQQKGPWVISQIRRMWDSGSLTADVNYWSEGMENWSPLVSLMEETAVPAPAAPILTPQSRPKVYKVTFESQSQTFGGTMPLMVKLAMRAVQDLGWKLENANETLGLVSFKTGISMGSWSGVSCSLNIEELEEGRFRVVGTGTQNVSGAQLAAMNFGEAARKANKAIERMKVIASSEK